jgi:4-hydroxythreonine-4-phosphate dehydrogenase
VIKKINTLRETLRKDFLIKHPKIAILAINPHAGDNGVIGSEDQEVSNTGNCCRIIKINI